MSEFQTYQRRVTTEYMRPYVSGEPMDGVSISDADKAAGAPILGGMIATSPENTADRWYVGADYFGKNFLPDPID